MENGTPAGTLRLIHIADLHFGAQADGALVALREALRALGPSLVVATGWFRELWEIASLWELSS